MVGHVDAAYQVAEDQASSELGKLQERGDLLREASYHETAELQTEHGNADGVLNEDAAHHVIPRNLRPQRRK